MPAELINNCGKDSVSKTPKVLVHCYSTVRLLCEPLSPDAVLLAACPYVNMLMSKCWCHWTALWVKQEDRTLDSQHLSPNDGCTVDRGFETKFLLICISWVSQCADIDFVLHPPLACIAIDIEKYMITTRKCRFSVCFPCDHECSNYPTYQETKTS